MARLASAGVKLCRTIIITNARERSSDRVSGSNQPKAVLIRIIHDRRIDKYREREVSALLALKAELEDKE